MEEQIRTEKNELSSLNIKDIFYKYVRFLPLFIVSVALSLFVAFIYLRYATLIYRSAGTMIIQDDKNNQGNSDKLDQIFASDNKKNIQDEIEYIQSRQMLSRVVRALNLNFTYKAKGSIKELNIYKANPFTVEALQINDSSGFTLRIVFEDNNRFRVNGEGPLFHFGDVFRNASGIFRLIRNPNLSIGKEYNVEWNPTTQVAAGLVSSLVVSPKQGTGILIITLETTNANLAADVVNELIQQYQQATREDKNQTNRNKLDYIDRELDTFYRQLDTITQRKLALLNRLKSFDPTAQSESYFRQLQDATTQLNEQRVLLNKTVQVERDLREGNTRIETPSSLGLTDPVLNELVTAYNQLQLERKSLLKYAPPGNAAVLQNEETLNNLRDKISTNLRNIRSSYGSIIGTLQRISGEANAQIELLPAKSQAVEEIRRQEASKLATLNLLLQKREESAIALASTISNIKVLQDATVNNTPVKPNRRNTQLLAIVVGLVLPALFIFVLELLNDKVTTRYDIEKITTAAILGEVGHSYGKNNLVVTNNNRGVVAEQFRIIRSNLQYVMNHIRKPVILVTSSFSGEGKSFISTNVGAVMALAGKKTIILEFDIRKPKILSHLNMPKRPGLTNYLLGKASIESLPVAVPDIENLFVLPCGPVPPNPAELLLDPKLGELFTYLRENFDIVIMDTAPVGMVSDAMTLSKYGDCTLYIVRQGHTYKKQIGLIDEFHRESKLPKISLILNDVKLRTGYGYYGYGRYGYGYGYGSGYFDDDADAQPPGIMRRWFGWLDIKTWNKKKKRKTNKV